MTLTREQMLHEMGFSPIWVLREPDSASNLLPEPSVPEPAPVQIQRSQTEPVSAPVAEPVAPLVSPSELDWPALARQVAECRACTLCQQRKQAVLGVGDRNPDWLFVGEGPGAEEDVQGEPFVGQAGKLLDNMLAALGIVRGNKVYIGNAVKCRPPGNRTPEAAEMTACRPYLERKIALHKPKIIVLLGKAAVFSVLNEEKTLSSMRGQRFEYAGIPVGQQTAPELPF